MRAEYVRVEVVCDRCREALHLCMPVPREVPQPIGCWPGPPSGSVGDGMVRCSVCDRCMLSLSELQGRVEDATRRGWGEHIRHGAVVIRCAG